MTNVSERFRRYIHQTGDRQKQSLSGFLPFLRWLPRYKWKAWLPADVIAGISVAALLIPESLAYAGVAGVPPEVGLYAAIPALIGYAIFGRSALLVVGASSGVAAVSASVVGSIATSDEEFIALTAGLALATGLLFLAAGLLRFGWVANFLSRAILTGFLIGLSISIMIGQLDDLLGIELEGGNSIAELIDALSQIGSWDGLTVAVGFTSLAALFILSRFVPRLPGVLIVVALAILAVSLFDLEAEGLLIVGDIPTGLPAVGVPEMTTSQFFELLLGGLAIVLIGFSEAYAAASDLAKKTGEDIDPNQELIAYGASNLGAGMTSGMVVAGSLSKSEANETSGAKSQIANIVNAGVVVLTLLFLAKLFENLALAVLAAVVIHALWRSANPARLRPFLVVNPADFSLGAITLAAVLLFDTLPAVLIGVVMSLLVLVYRVSFPHTAELGFDPAAGRFMDIELHDGAKPIPGVVVYRFDAPLLYSNSKAFFDGAMELVDKAEPAPNRLIIDGEVIGNIDTTGIEKLADLVERLEERQIGIELARFHTPVLEQMLKSDQLDDLDLGNIASRPFISVDIAAHEPEST